MLRGPSRIAVWRASIAAGAVVLALAVLPVSAWAASVEASPVVTVPGSVVTVDGTVTLSVPVELSTSSVAAIAAAVSSQVASATAAGAVDAGTIDFFKVGVAVTVCAVCTLVGAKAAGL